MRRWFLAQNPAALRKLERELNAAALLKTVKNPNPRTFTYADISKLHWLDCCIKVGPALATASVTSCCCCPEGWRWFPALFVYTRASKVSRIPWHCCW